MSAGLITFVLLVIGSLMTANHARVTLRNRSSGGASRLSTVYFTGMAAWQAWFYGSLGEPWACAGCVLLMLAHIAWLALLWRFRRASSGDLNYLRILS